MNSGMGLGLRHSLPARRGALAKTSRVKKIIRLLFAEREILITEQLLDIITQIRQELREDRSDPFVQRLSFPNDITPFFARELSNSYGWTLMFNITGIDMV